MIPDEIIDEIRTRADIVAVIGQHVQLKRTGRSWKGLCPFHGEKSPSFNVSPDKGFFYCFGCHKKGDVFTFVMEYEGKSFHETAEQLAASAAACSSSTRSPPRSSARPSRTPRAAPPVGPTSRSAASATRRATSSSSATRRPTGTRSPTT